MNDSEFREFDPIFHPKSIAVIGASEGGRKSGNLYLSKLVENAFKGNLYAVNSTGGDVMGVKGYKSLSAIPKDVDYVIVTIPKNHILNLLDECRLRNVKVVQIFSAGFSESGEEEGQALETAIIEKARRLGIRIIGPNCIGVYCPSSRFSMPSKLGSQAWEIGTVSFLCQSGGHGSAVSELGLTQGVRFNKVISYGNGSDLSGLDFLRYFGADSGTSIIGAYLEGMPDGRPFLQELREITPIKPVVVWKAGDTYAGVRTAASHTASMAGSNAVWDGALRQAGAIKVMRLEELCDTILALHHLPRFEGRQVGVVAGLVGAGGGASVASSDACVREGLEVKVLTEETITRLKSILPAAGSIFINPVDVGAVASFNMKRFAQALDLVLNDPNTDLVIVHLPMSVIFMSLSASGIDELLNILTFARKRQEKPVILLAQSAQDEPDELEFVKKCSDAGIPGYPTFDRAARALANATSYWRFRAEIEAQ